MTFIVHSSINEQNLCGSLGMPEYSYYFVLQGFLPVLREMGQVIVVSDPEQEVDAIYDECHLRGEECVYLTFSPPNKAIVGLRCPAVCVFAWEFDRIPDEVWDGEPKNDWRNVLRRHGWAITLSRYSAEAVRQAMGGDFQVAAIPVPVWDEFENYRRFNGKGHSSAGQRITFNGNIVDSRNYAITADSFELKATTAPFELKPWNGESLKLEFTETDEHSAYLGGFYQPEPWGTWSRIGAPWVWLPYQLNGQVDLRIILWGYAGNANRRIFVSLGDNRQEIRIENGVAETDVHFCLAEPQNMLKFSGLDLSPVLNAPDPRSMGIGLRSIEIAREPRQEWNGETLRFGFTQTDEGRACLRGFYQAESWGAWSRIAEPWVYFPCRLCGEVRFRIKLCGYGRNAKRGIWVSLGKERKKIRIKNGYAEAEVQFCPKEPQCRLKFSGLDLSPIPNKNDSRSMAIGLQSIEISGIPAQTRCCSTNTCHVDNPIRRVNVEGIVYTSVFNPGDDRKNWTDMVKGFCMAFRDVPDATLLLKMTHHSLTSFIGKLQFLLQQMWPFKCRIVALHSFLEKDEYENLIAATSFYVNTSRCEGLCLPLMEFMACGKPAIAPCNTSLTDYVDSSSSVIVKSTVEPSIWPHDSRQVFRALKYRIDFESLVNAYKRSYDIVKNCPENYKQMANAASLKMKSYSSRHEVTGQLREMFEKMRKKA